MSKNLSQLVGKPFTATIAGRMGCDPFDVKLPEQVDIKIGDDIVGIGRNLRIENGEVLMCAEWLPWFQAKLDGLMAAGGDYSIGVEP